MIQQKEEKEYDRTSTVGRFDTWHFVDGGMRIRKGAVGMVQEISGQASGRCLCNGQMAVRKIYDETGDGKQSFGAYGPGAGIFPELPEAGPLHTSAFAFS